MVNCDTIFTYNSALLLGREKESSRSSLPTNIAHPANGTALAPTVEEEKEEEEKVVEPPASLSKISLPANVVSMLKKLVRWVALKSKQISSSSFPSFPFGLLTKQILILLPPLFLHLSLVHMQLNLLFPTFLSDPDPYFVLVLFSPLPPTKRILMGNSERLVGMVGQFDEDDKGHLTENQLYEFISFFIDGAEEDVESAKGAAKALHAAVREAGTHLNSDTIFTFSSAMIKVSNSIACCYPFVLSPPEDVNSSVFFMRSSELLEIIPS